MCLSWTLTSVQSQTFRLGHPGPVPDPNHVDERLLDELFDITSPDFAPLHLRQLPSSFFVCPAKTGPQHTQSPMKAPAQLSKLVGGLPEPWVHARTHDGLPYYAK